MTSLKTCIIIYIYIYIHICKDEVSKSKIIVNALYIPVFYYFLFVYLFEVVYVNNNSKTIFWERVHYMRYDLYWQYCTKVRMFLNGQLDSLQPLPT